MLLPVSRWYWFFTLVYNSNVCKKLERSFWVSEMRSECIIVFVSRWHRYFMMVEGNVDHTTLQSLISEGTKFQIAMNQECGISKQSTLLHCGIASENIDKGCSWLYVLLTRTDSMMNGLSAHKIELWKTSLRYGSYLQESRNATVIKNLKS